MNSAIVPAFADQFRQVAELYRDFQNRGKELAERLFLISSAWEREGRDPDDLLDALEAHAGIPRRFARTLIRVWGIVEGLPPDRRQEVKAWPLDKITAVAGMIARQGLPEESEWRKIAIAPSASEARKAIREIEGKRTTSLSLVWRRDGTLVVFAAEPVSIGFIVRDWSDLPSEVATKVQTLITILEKHGLLVE